MEEKNDTTNIVEEQSGAGNDADIKTTEMTEEVQGTGQDSSNAVVFAEMEVAKTEIDTEATSALTGEAEKEKTILDYLDNPISIEGERDLLQEHRPSEKEDGDEIKKTAVGEKDEKKVKPFLVKGNDMSKSIFNLTDWVQEKGVVETVISDIPLLENTEEGLHDETKEPNPTPKVSKPVRKMPSLKRINSLRFNSLRGRFLDIVAEEQQVEKKRVEARQVEDQRIEALQVKEKRVEALQVEEKARSQGRNAEITKATVPTVASAEIPLDYTEEFLTDSYVPEGIVSSDYVTIDMLQKQVKDTVIPSYLQDFEITFPGSEVVVSSVSADVILQRETQMEEARIREATVKNKKNNRETN